jgi:hypothetical protein
VDVSAHVGWEGGGDGLGNVGDIQINGNKSPCCASTGQIEVLFAFKINLL